jgi:nucleotide-binding universal stress UspA family protein
LVALDGTPAAEQILEPAGELARLTGADITLIRVLLPAATGVFPSEQLWAAGHAYFDRVEASLREKGIAVKRCLVARAHPATAILEEAETGGYDLLALATRGRRGLPRLFLGSVADKVVRGTPIPVLVHRCLPA